MRAGAAHQRCVATQQDRRRVPRHDDWPAPVRTHKARRRSPKLGTYPQQVVGRLARHHIAQRRHVCARRGAGTRGVRKSSRGSSRAGHRQVRPRRKRVYPGMGQQVGTTGIAAQYARTRRGARTAIVHLDYIEKRQLRDPVDKVGRLIRRQRIQAARGSGPAVHLPNKDLALVLAHQGVQQHALVVAHEHASVGQGAHQAQHAHGVRPAVDHIAQHVDDVAATGSRKLERAIQRPNMTVSIRGYIRRHISPSGINLQPSSDSLHFLVPGIAKKAICPIRHQPTMNAVIKRRRPRIARRDLPGAVCYVR